MSLAPSLPTLSPNEQVLLNAVLGAITSNMRPVGVVAIGSVLFPWSYDSGTSDVDLVLITEDEIDPTRAVSELRAIVLELSGFFGREPQEVADFQSRRVEAKFWYQGLKFDVAIAPASVGIGQLDSEILSDNLELYLGNVYVHGVLLFGDRPIIRLIEKLHPYLPDEMRATRMLVVRKAIEDLLSSDRPEVRLISHLVRLQFLAQRAYPLSVTKRLLVQAEQLLGGEPRISVFRGVIEALLGEQLTRTQRNKIVREFVARVSHEI